MTFSALRHLQTGGIAATLSADSFSRQLSLLLSDIKLFCLLVNGVSDFLDVVQAKGDGQGLVKKPFQLFQRNKLKLE